jgi:hypothetical protein
MAVATRSTIQRLGSTRKRCSSSGLTVSSFQVPGLGDGGRGLRPLVRGISEDTLDEREEPARAPVEGEQGRFLSGRERLAVYSLQNGGFLALSAGLSGDVCRPAKLEAARFTDTFDAFESIRAGRFFGSDV